MIHSPRFPRFVPQRLHTAGVRPERTAFSLIELLVTLLIIGVMTGLAIPAITSMQYAGDITKAAYDLGDALENARSYAMANNTYVWVGFFEEDGSKNSATPAIPGIGRIVISTVASQDGTSIYDPSSTGQHSIDPTSLRQINKLIKIENAHLASFSDGSGTGGTFDTRPAAGSNNARIGDTNPPTATDYPFQYPVGNRATTAQYTFVTTIQFNPRGENMVNSTYSMKPVVEIGLQRTHGTVVDTNDKNVVALQITGVGGNVTIYRR